MAEEEDWESLLREFIPDITDAQVARMVPIVREANNTRPNNYTNRARLMVLATQIQLVVGSRRALALATGMLARRRSHIT